MGFLTDFYEKLFPPPEEIPEKQQPEQLWPKDDNLKMDCIQSEKCKEFKSNLQTCQVKISRTVVPRGETCDPEILNFINCFEECISAQKYSMK